MAAWLTAQTSGVTVARLVTLVRASISRGEPDKSLAKSLRKLALSERLDSRTIEELESQGAGAESVAELERLRERAIRLPAPSVPPEFAEPPRPSADEQSRFFKEMSTNAMDYTASLPNFICDQTVRRYVRNPGQESWFPRDVLTVRLTYFEKRERYDLIHVDGRNARVSYQSVGGFISEGDFGSTLVLAFAPEAATQFQWDHWTHLRKRLTRVYSYRTSKDKSHYRINAGPYSANQTTVVAGRHGYIYADDETKMVFRITGEADSIPAGFSVTGVSSVVDYDFADVAGHRALLPLRAEVRLWTELGQFRNVVEFRGYRKFTGEAAISY